MRTIIAVLATIITLIPGALSSWQAERAEGDLTWLTNTVAVSGYESALSKRIMHELEHAHPHQDAMGNVCVTFGYG